MKIEMKYRHEWKHEIHYADFLMLKPRLCAVTKPDSHSKDGSYLVRSLYFDNASDKALREKIDGVNFREKFRIRYYDCNTDLIRLEKKSKVNGLCAKESATLSKEQVQSLLEGNYDWMISSQEPLILELYSKIKSEGLRPKTIVTYTRAAYIFAPGNVRVTIDDQIRTSTRCNDFLNTDYLSIPINDSPIILEVKWDEYLADIIRDIVQLPHCRSGAFSKYAACRTYG